MYMRFVDLVTASDRVPQKVFRVVNEEVRNTCSFGYISDEFV